MATDFGKCISVTTDLPDKWRYITGQQVVAEALLRRWSTERGTLPYDLNYGTDIRGAIGESMTNAVAAQWAVALEREAEKDERITSCDVSLSFNPSTGKLTVTAKVQTAEGEFSLVVSVDEVTAELLRVDS